MYCAKQHKFTRDHCPEDKNYSSCTECIDESLGFGFYNSSPLTDSGSRREFESGAVRDICEGKGRCDLLPLGIIADYLNFIGYDSPGDGVTSLILSNIGDYVRCGDTSYITQAIYNFINAKYDGREMTALLELSKHYEAGAQKYSERNWEKGIPCHCYVDSGVRHFLKFCRGDNDEPHDRAFLWNMFGLLWTLENKPEMNDLPCAEKTDEEH